MDKVRSVLLNPNVHGGISFLAQLAAFIPGPWGVAAQVLAGVALATTATTIALPENTSLHKDDYAKIVADSAAAVVKVLQTPARQ